MRWKPKNKRMLVSPTVQDNVTESGLYIPESAKEVPMSGTVVAVSKECTDYVAGDQILFGRYAGSTINVDGRDCLILLEEDVFCCLDREAA